MHSFFDLTYFREVGHKYKNIFVCFWFKWKYPKVILKLTDLEFHLRWIAVWKIRFLTFIVCRYCLSLDRLQGERFENWWQKILSKCIWFAFTWIPLRPKINVPKLHFSVQAGNVKLARTFFFSLNLFQNIFTGTFSKKVAQPVQKSVAF
mgnify:CR=1 FL=1